MLSQSHSLRHLIRYYFNSCGTCSSETSCECTAWGWECDSEYRDPGNCIVDYGPHLPRSCDASDFSDLIGGTCIEARTQILKVHPGFTVICASESGPRPSLQFLRYIVLTDDISGAVTSIKNYTQSFFNSCPDIVDMNEGARCHFDDNEQECVYEEFVERSFISSGINTTCIQHNNTCRCILPADPTQELGSFRCNEEPTGYSCTRVPVGE